MSISISIYKAYQYSTIVYQYSITFPKTSMKIITDTTICSKCGRHTVLPSFKNTCSIFLENTLHTVKNKQQISMFKERKKNDDDWNLFE